MPEEADEERRARREARSAEDVALFEERTWTRSWGLKASGSCKSQGEQGKGWNLETTWREGLLADHPKERESISRY